MLSSAHTQLQLREHQSVQKAYMGVGTLPITRFFSLQYFKVLWHYWGGVNERDLLHFRPTYSKMVHSQYFWHQFRSKPHDFSILKQLFMAQQGPFIFIFVMAMVVGTAALFGAYYQRFLFSQLIEEQFETSGWVFFAIIMVSAVFRLFLFNYIQGLANQVATNSRIHLENMYIRLMFALPKDIQQGLLVFNYFVSIDHISQGIKLLPYFISSLVIVLGIVGFIVAIVGVIGIVTLGLTIIFVVLQVFLLYYMLGLHEQYAQISQKRNHMTNFGTSFLLRLTYSGLAQSFMKQVTRLRKMETNIDLKYNLSDGMIQVLTETISFMTILIFYLVSQYFGTVLYFQIFEVAVLFSVFKTPVKMVAYGFASLMQMYGSAHLIHQLLQKCQRVERVQQDMYFPRVYVDRNTLWERDDDFLTVKSNHVPQIVLKSKNPMLHQFAGKLIMVVGKLDAKPTNDQYLTRMKQFLQDDTYIEIQYEPFILDTTIRQNILFGLPFNEQKYNKVLQVVHLRVLISKFSEKDETRMDENYFKTIYLGLSFKIELARALYCDVGILIINRVIFKQFDIVLRNVKEYRRQFNHTTIVVNLSGSHYQLADWIIVLGHNSKEQGTYSDLIQRSQILRQFVTEYVDHISLVTHDVSNSHTLTKLDEVQYTEDLDVSFTRFFQFYRFNHVGAGIVLVVLLLMPPLVDLYMEVIIAESKDLTFTDQGQPTEEEKDHITLRYGMAVLLFSIMNCLKVIIFALYIRVSAYKIFRKVMHKFLYTKIQSTLDLSNRKSALDLQRNLQSIDVKVTSQLDIGLTTIFQQLSALVFGAVSSLLFLGIGLPFLAVTLLIIIFMVIYSRRIYYGRRKNRSKLNSFMKKLINHRRQFITMGKNQYIFNQFIVLNEEDLVYDLNQEWILESLGIILEIMFIAMLGIVMGVSLSQFQELHKDQEAFIQLAISFLIGLTNAARINLKIFKSMDKQLVGITSLFKIIQQHDNHHSHKYKTIEGPIKAIQYKKFCVCFKDDILHQLDLTLNAGQRCVVMGSRISGKRVLFYSLLRIFQKEHIRGQVLVNGMDLYAEKVSRQFLATKIHIIENRPLLTVGSTVKQNLVSSYPHLQQQDIPPTLRQLWQILGTEPLFDENSQVAKLGNSYLDIFALARALLIKPEVLIIEGGFSNIDTINRQKITKWLINNKDISIIMDLTNRIEVIGLYPRKLRFADGVMVEDSFIGHDH